MSVPYQNINAIADTVKEMQGLKTDSLIGISGPEGVGKTTCSYGILNRVMRGEVDIDRIFNLNRNIAYTSTEVEQKLKNAPMDTGLIIDEAGRIFYKRDAMTARTREGIKLFQQIRFRHLAVFANIPPFFSLDKEIREQRIWLWIHVYSRGSAMAFIKDMNVFSEDPWHTKRNQQIIAKYYRGPSDGQEALLDGYRETKNFIGEFKFPRMPVDVEERYEKISFERKLVADVPVETKNAIALKWKSRVKILGNELVHCPLEYSVKDIAKMLKLTPSALYMILTDKKEGV